MTDKHVRPLVDRLRDNKGGFIGGRYDLEAADEIERLRFALKHLVHNIKATGKRLDLGLAMEVAEAALKDTP
jgi:hypothetical protein